VIALAPARVRAGPRVRRLLDDAHAAVAAKRRRFRALVVMPSRDEREEEEYGRLLGDDDLWDA
jgi:hypothetical protein